MRRGGAQSTTLRPLTKALRSQLEAAARVEGFDDPTSESTNIKIAEDGSCGATTPVQLRELANAVSVATSKLDHLNITIHHSQPETNTMSSMQPPFFYGFVSENFAEFLHHFNIYSLQPNLSEDHRLQTLSSYLQGLTASTYTSPPDEVKNKDTGATFQGLCEALIEKFVMIDKRAYAQRALVARKQLPVEAFTEYAPAMQIAFNKAYPVLTMGGEAMTAVRTQQLLHAI